MRKSNVRVYFLQWYLNENSFNIYNFTAFSKQNIIIVLCFQQDYHVKYNEKQINVEGMRNPVNMDVHIHGFG